ncbi:hypothetical protein CDN99_24285 [Roseateles aquatilis]|uniref:Uncharacterized protein n=1 Tax=Roseateles aquatilis TaxID=431061 RepID=A0A246IWJ4_9BURK|nr:hypothetical protein [Roseateles aquatilis]OWQ84417.1 hypothetical protein CDN99_24285 [Roseateles aquatilis]
MLRFFPVPFLFRRARHDALRAALCDAVASRRIGHIDRLLDRHGPSAFAQALSGMSCRIAADILSVLPEPRRQDLLSRLPRRLRGRVPLAAARDVVPMPRHVPLQGLLVRPPEALGPSLFGR